MIPMAGYVSTTAQRRVQSITDTAPQWPAGDWRHGIAATHCGRTGAPLVQLVPNRPWRAADERRVGGGARGTARGQRREIAGYRFAASALFPSWPRRWIGGRGFSVRASFRRSTKNPTLPTYLPSSSINQGQDKRRGHAWIGGQRTCRSRARGRNGRHGDGQRSPWKPLALRPLRRCRRGHVYHVRAQGVNYGRGVQVVNVALGSAETAMPKGVLNHAKVNPFIRQTCGKRVAQAVRVAALGDVRLAAESLEQAAHVGRLQRFVGMKIILRGLMTGIEIWSGRRRLR